MDASSSSKTFNQSCTTNQVSEEKSSSIKEAEGIDRAPGPSFTGEDTEDNLLSQLADFDFANSSDSDTQAPCPSTGLRKKKLPKKSTYQQLKQRNAENVQKWNEIIAKGEIRYDTLPPLSSFYELPAEPPEKIVRNRNLDDMTEVFQCNAWDNVVWDDEQKQQALEAISKHQNVKVDSDKKEKLEAEAYKFWDDFYGNHKNKFFRDRNWLFSEFPELESPFGASVDPEEAVQKLVEYRSQDTYPGEKSNFKVLEVGCGAGNTVFPLLAWNNNPNLYVYCCDFSPQAVALVHKEPTFDAARCTPFVLDITDENPVTPFPEGSLDVITTIFVMSAISPGKFSQVVKNFHKFLKPGGLVLFRDYGRYDLAQLRFKEGRCIDDNFYMRGDGTRAYFFEEEEVETMFVKGGFEKHSLIVDRRLQVNRIKELKMYRIWVQGKFRKTW